MSQIWFVTKLAQRILLGPTHPKFPTHTCSGWRQCRCEDGAERSPLGIRRQFLQRVSTAPGSSFSASSRGAARAGVAPSGYGPPRRAPTQPAGPWPLAHACGGGGWVDDGSSPHQDPQDLLAADTQRGARPWGRHPPHATHAVLARVVAAADATLVFGARQLDGGVCVLEAHLQARVVEKGQPQIRLRVIDIDHRLNPPCCS